MNGWIYTILTVLLLTASGSADAAILMKSQDGTFTVKASLSTAAVDPDGVGKTFVVTSPLSAAMSNISSATIHAWPADRRLVIENGGSVANSTIFRASGKVVLDGGTISGTGQAKGNISVIGLYHAFTGTGAIKIQSGEDVFPEWFGAKLNGTDDDSVAVNLAINSTQGATSPTFHRPVIRLSSGEWTLNNSINLVNKGAGTSLIGAGKYLTYIKGRTGNKPVIDCGGTTSIRVSGMAINAYSGQNPSTIGIQQLSQLNGAPEGLQGTFDDLFIWLPDDITANGGIGTIGILNSGAEETTYKNIRSLANAPLILTKSRTLTNVIADSTTFVANTAFATLVGDPPSEGVFVLDHVSLHSIGKRRSSLIAYGTNNIKGSLYLWGGTQPIDGEHQTAPKIGSHQYAMQFIGGNANHNLTGNIERWGAVATFGGYIENTQALCANLNLDFMKSIPDSEDIDSPLFDLVLKNDTWTNKESAFQNCRWSVAMTGNDSMPFYQRNPPFKDGPVFFRPFSNHNNELIIFSYPSKASGKPLAYEATNALFNNDDVYHSNSFVLTMNEKTAAKMGSVKGQMYVNIGPIASGTRSTGVLNKEVLRFLKSKNASSSQAIGSVTIKGLIYGGGSAFTALTTVPITVKFMYQLDGHGDYNISAATIITGTETINTSGISTIETTISTVNYANYISIFISTSANVIGGPFPLVLRIDSVDTDGYGKLMEPMIVNGTTPS